jgi:GTP-binding protein
VSAVSAARPKIAGYPFTTIEPVLGEVAVGNRHFIIAEIPGLIEGAHSGKGLGHDFLRHAERTKVLIHLLDGSSKTLQNDLLTLSQELELYSHELAAKAMLVVINKIDLPEVSERKADIAREFSSAGINVYFISGMSGEGVEELLNDAVKVLAEVEGQMKNIEPPPKIFRPVQKDGKG